MSHPSQTSHIYIPCLEPDPYTCLGVNLSAVCHPVHVAGALIIEELGLHVDMYYRVIPSQIIMLYATMSSHVEHFCYELVQQKYYFW